jgi:hypothetical protein
MACAKDPLTLGVGCRSASSNPVTVRSAPLALRSHGCLLWALPATL